MVGYYGQGVSDVENSHAKKYNVSGREKSGIRISKLLCFFLVMGAILLAALSALAVFLLMPMECSSDAPPAAHIEAGTGISSNLNNISPVPVRQSTGIRSGDILLKRLPENVIPIHYTLKLMPFLIEDNFTTHGNVSIDIECKEAVDKIYLHAVDISINRNSIRIKYIAGDYFFRLLDLTYDEDDEMYTFHLDRKMRTGEKYMLHMSFVSQLNDLNQGFYRIKYFDKESNSSRWIASTQFSPIDARRAFPCFDEPGFKATFTISVARPNYMTTLSNMPRLDTEESIEMPGYSWDNYERSPRMSTYLVAFIVSDLQPYEFSQDGREFSIWSRKEVINEAIYSSTISPKMLRYYEKYFDIKFPLPKMDQVAVPDFGYSAMENWGLIIYREQTLLIHEGQSDLGLRVELVKVMAHELSHQWFGNLVTPRFWDELWLKEGFSNFFSYRGANHVEPSWNISNNFLADMQLTAMSQDCFTFTRPLSVEMLNKNQIFQAFDGIAYLKGASIIHMLQNIFSEDSFREALKHYLTKHQYGNAMYQDLAQAFIERNHIIPGLVGNNDLKSIMETWSTQPGFPVVTVIADYENNTLTLTQKRFFYAPIEEDKKSKKREELWWIPVSYVTRSQADFDDTKPKFWLKPEVETKVQINNIKDGYLLNLRNTGYYFVNYDEKNWQQIILNFRNFPLLERAQLIANSMELARANLLDYDVPLKLLTAVGRWDHNSVTYEIAFSKLVYVSDMLVSQPIFSKFNTFVDTIFDQSFANTLPIEHRKDTYETKKLRALILNWACRSDESRCVAHARTLFRSLMVSNTPVQSNLRKLVYSVAIRCGGETEFNFAYQLYLNATSATEKNSIISALGSTKKPWLLRSYLDMMMDPKSGLRKQDGYNVFAAVARSGIIGQQIAFTFMRENWNKLKDYFGLGFNILGKMVGALPKFMNTESDLEQLSAFANSFDLATAENTYKRVYENVRMNVEWMKKNYPSLKQWIETHKEHYGY